MPEEIEGVTALLDNPVTTILGMRKYTRGTLNNIETVVVFSRWGKVAAAATVATLIAEFKITELIFTGVAGAVHTNLNIGDIVIGSRLIQHDMDARPLMPQFEIPLLGKTYFETDTDILTSTQVAIEQLIYNKDIHNTIGTEKLAQFSIDTPALYVGDIAIGDKFFASTAEKDLLNNSLPSVLCVEMEGAAVAQVCYEYKVPFVIIRIISDTADDNSHIDFPAFIKNISSNYSVAIINSLYKISENT